MHKLLGPFVEPGTCSEYVIMSFSASQLSIQERWRNNSLSADFLADYWETFLFSQHSAGQPAAAHLKDTVSYVANELLENAVKFHTQTPGSPICLSIYQRGRNLRFYVSNSIRADSVEAFQAYLHTLLTEDPAELFLRQLEQNAEDEENTESHLGLLTLLNDYGTHLGWKFETLDQWPETVTVTTMAELELDL